MAQLSTGVSGDLISVQVASSILGLSLMGNQSLTVIGLPQ